MYKISRNEVLTGIIVLMLGILSIFIIQDFIIPLIFTGILVYMYHPLYLKINKKIKNHFITSFLSIILVLTLIVVPIVFTFLEVSGEFSNVDNDKITGALETVNNLIYDKYNFNLNLVYEYNLAIEKGNIYIKQMIFEGLPQFVFNLFIIIFFFYYFLKNYTKESSYFKIFFRKETLNKWDKQIRKLLNGIVYGQILVRLIQAGIGTILFILIGIKGAVFWGILMFFVAFLPVFGTALVWIPLMILSLIDGEYDIALYLLVIGFIVSTIDNLIMPYIISEKAKIGPIITLISILGGLQLFGIYGLILGPFFLGLFFVTLEEFIFRIRKENPQIKRYLWTEKERDKFRQLKTDEAKTEFVRMIENKYKKEEQKGNNVNYRYICEQI